jgi:hypothetical protein
MAVFYFMPEGLKTNVRKHRDRKSEANFKEPKRNYRQSKTDQIQPGSYKEKSGHNFEKSGQPENHHRESKTDPGFVEEVGNKNVKGDPE